MFVWSVAAIVFLFGVGSTVVLDSSPAPRSGPYFLPRGDDVRSVTVTSAGQAVVEFNVLTEAVAVKESGPKQTVARFGEVYSFSPTFLAVTMDEAVRLTFWNLQADDDHDLALMALESKSHVLMWVDLPPLKKTSYVFTFHKPGLYRFLCLRHQPEMAGEIEVLPRPRA
jgi:plastocyanin